MDVSGIFTIGGKPGLFKLVAQSKNGIIVESLLDGKRFNAYASYKISSLDDISVFTETEDLPLVDVLTKIAEKESFKFLTFLDTASKDEMKAYFETVISDYDKERVYDSDIKKILKWYNLLQKNDLLKSEEESTDTAEKEETIEDAEIVEETKDETAE